MNKFILTLAALVLCTIGLNARQRADAVKQTPIQRVEQMPSLPQPLKIIDWRQKALDFDAFVFDFDTQFPSGPMIWWDNSRKNLPQTTFGLYTAVHDVRQGPEANGGMFHESLNTMAAVMGAGLLGIDKTRQHGHNFVKMLQNYYNSESGWNIVMNNTCPEVALQGGGYGRDWWYDVLPNILFYGVSSLFPEVEGADEIQRRVADKFYEADKVLNGNYDYSYFDYKEMQGKRNHIPYQQDAAGGHGYLLLMAYHKYGDDRYLEGAKSAIAALNNQKGSRFYEILLPLGVYTAGVLNARYGTDYDVAKMLDWVFDGCTDSTGRTGWGVITGRWGDYDVSGLQGSITDGGGYGFLMNSIKLSWPFVPLVKYQPQYARAIGKWMLNNVNACRLCYPDQIDDTHQALPHMKEITRGLVAYEGIRRTDLYNQERLKGVEPVALGDGPNWNPRNPPESMFSLYSTAPVGVFGAMVEKTDIEGILKLNCNTTDFYAPTPFGCYLLYNPYKEQKRVEYGVSKNVDLFDIVNKEYVARNVTAKTLVTLPADGARLIVEIPAGKAVSSRQGRWYVDDHCIAYR